MSEPLKLLLIGCGNMGTSHSLAYKSIPEYRFVGVADVDEGRREGLAKKLGGAIPTFADGYEAIRQTRPEVVAICTLPATHEQYAVAALEAGAHVFLEKPMATTIAAAKRIVAAARKHDRKVLIGYALRHHPAWAKFVEVARTLGKPLVMRMNLNQQTQGDSWNAAKRLLTSTSPIVDCGVHYVDMMCLMTGGKPVSVSAIGVRLADDIAPDMYNYGQLQVRFDDGSVGWYEAGWGPMVSETAYFVKDVFGPRGSVSIVNPPPKEGGHSADRESHGKADFLLVHHAETDSAGRFTRKDEMIDVSAGCAHEQLLRNEHLYLLKAIRENIDLSQHLSDGVNSLRIVLAADESVRTGKTVEVKGE